MFSYWVGLVNEEANLLFPPCGLLIQVIVHGLDKQLGVIKLKCYLFQMKK